MPWRSSRRRRNMRGDEVEGEAARKKKPKMQKLPTWMKLMGFLLLVATGASACEIGIEFECPAFSPFEKRVVPPGDSLVVGHLQSDARKWTLENDVTDYVVRIYSFEVSQSYNCKNESSLPICIMSPWKSYTCPGFALERMGNGTAIVLHNVTEASGYCTFSSTPGDYHVYQVEVILDSTPPADDHHIDQVDVIPESTPTAPSYDNQGYIIALVFLGLYMVVTLLIGIGFAIKCAFNRYGGNQSSSTPPTVSNGVGNSLLPS